ncbi:UDP-glucose dehydrogenase family protein [Ruegeria atlantica]|uniref:UDP-glucose dehydrogenase family protein n=1 Tax=Ruegeria atlantica TaxID=81569 RepID=UPI00147CA568|nr:UDP-glucose/GDP-mannose dehydrogenase family protein [Ruegeria atlantica]
MRVSVIGTGYVGLVSGACLAMKGHDVVCVDTVQQKIDQINACTPPIHEDGLADLLCQTVGQTLHGTTDLRDAVLNSDISLIAVGTPFDGNEIDLRYIRDVSRQIGEVIKDKDAYHVVVVKSTVVPGTTDTVVRPILEEASGKRAGQDFGIGMNPEFLKEGEAITDFMHPDRIVIGGGDDRAIAAMDELYSVFPNVDIVRTNPATAEMIKYTANSLLATLISFSNEIGNLCANVGVDVVEAMEGMHLDKRFTPILPENAERIWPGFITYLAAGCGFGGSCFPKDVKALIAYGENAGSPMPLLNAVMQTNNKQPGQMLDRLKSHFPDLRGKRIAVLGLAFKPGTDDIRESPALTIVHKLLTEQAEVVAYDPVARHEAEAHFSDSIAYEDELSRAIEGADAVMIVTRWPEFSKLPDLVKTFVPQPLVIDGRRMIPKDSVANYEGIGLQGLVR